MEIKEYIGMTGKTWFLNVNEQFTVQELISSSREVFQGNEDDSFFLIQQSLSIHGMQEAVDLTIKAIKGQKKIGIIGDYDVDGSSSISLMILFLRLLDIECSFLIPNRFTDGYGPSPYLLDKMREKGVELLFIADCGSTSVKELQYAKDIGLDTIIIDHHSIAQEGRPAATVILNPQINQHEMMYLCSAGLTFMFLWNLRKQLKEENIFNIPKKQMMKLLELAALGTVCDMVPLVGLNRFIVQKGLEISNQPNSTLNRFLALNNKYHSCVSEGYMGFYIGPKINSSGRFGFTELAVYSLTQENSDEQILKMEILNNARKKVEKVVLDKCLGIVKKNQENLLQNDHVILIEDNAENGFFAPVLGIVAGKIKDKETKSVFIVSWSGDIGKGSARSLDNLHTGKAMESARAKNILIDGGGHRNAGGFSLERGKLQEFWQHLTECVDQSFQPEASKIDAILSLSALNSNLSKTLKKLSPFGQKNPHPIFLFPNVKIRRYTLSSSGVLICTITDCFEKRSISGLCISQDKSESILQSAIDGWVNLVCIVQETGKDLSLRIIDLVKEKSSSVGA